MSEITREMEKYFETDGAPKILRAQEPSELSPAPGSDFEDPYQSEEYQRFVEDSAKFCHCADPFRPCDGVLAGGICDMHLETDRWEFQDE